MPTYEYRCNDCGHEMEAFHKISDPALKECPSCHKPALERLISGGTFHLKGSGWYKDLYSKPESKTPAKTDGQSADKVQKAIDTSSKSESPKSDSPTSDGSKKKASSEAA